MIRLPPSSTQSRSSAASDVYKRQIKQALTEHLPKGGKALLFGSQARGDARIDSDWDILIILDKEKLEPEDYDKVSFPLTMLGLSLIHI